MKRYGNAGQATLEYVLLLCISLIIIAGVIYQFNDAFRQYANQLFVGEDSYLFCLIESAILPGDGCDDHLPHFNLKAGRQKKLDWKVSNAQNSFGDGGSSSSAGNNSNPAGDTSSSKRSLSPDSKAGSSANTSKPSAGRVSEVNSSMVPASAGDFKGFGKFASGSASGREDRGKANTGSTKTSSTTGGGLDALGNGSSSNGAFSREPIFIKLGGDRSKNALSTIPVNERDLKTAREIAAEKAKKKRAEDEVNASFSFGNLFRWLLILAILFAIVFFVGSQFFAVARGNKRQ